MASPLAAAIVLALVSLRATVDAGNVPMRPLTVTILDGPRVVDGNNVFASFTSSRPSAALSCRLTGRPRIDCEYRDAICIGTTRAHTLFGEVAYPRLTTYGGEATECAMHTCSTVYV